jgi:hypothetical protein
VASSPAAAAPAPPALHEEPGVYSLTVILAALALSGVIAIPLDKDNDFVLTGIIGKSTGDFLFQFQTPDGRYVQSQPVHASSAVGTGQFPKAVFPTITYKAGQMLRFQVIDASTAPNTVEIDFEGIKQYQLGS